MLQTASAQVFVDRDPAGMPIQHDGTSVAPLDPLSVGTGAAWFDANADGHLDLYITMRTGNNLLYLGDGNGGFVESAVAFQVHDPTGDGSGVAVADFNNDGYDDLFLANSRSDRLLRNDGGTGFTDVTAIAGIDLTDESRGTSASWADYDLDGYVDLYIANHVPMSGAGNADTQDHLYRNNGDGTFTDVSGLLADAGTITGATFIGGWMDYDLDGDADLIVINDCVTPNYIPNQVFRNDGDTHPVLDWNFTEVSPLLGVDSCANGMGLAMGDYDRDGMPDYFFSNIGSTILFQNTGAGFVDASVSAGTGGQPWPLFSWGTCFFDADLDGWEDLFVVFGSHHFDSATDPHYDQFFLNDGNGVSFTNRSGDLNLADSMRGRTVVVGDYDRDGDRDLAIINYGEDIRIKENDLVHAHHYLDIKLHGTKSNRNGIGARLRIRTPDGDVQWRQLYSGSSLGGGDELTVHFGLGTNDRVDTLHLFWPGATVPQVVTDIMADQRITIREYDPGAASITFQDVATALGVDGACGLCSTGNGVSFADFNGDGRDDLTFGTQAGDSVLFYVNNGSGFDKLPSLVNATERNMTPLWFDYDNDGDKDLLLANFQGQNRLYRNDGNLSLTEITATCGLLSQIDPTYSACAADYDQDGDLDFYLGNWFSTTYTNYLYRNDGSDTFTEVGVAAGVDDSLNLTLASGFFDYNNDGWVDLYNSQDRHFSFNSLFHNNGDGTFADVSAQSNTDIGIDAMNVGIGDYNNDDFMDIYVTNTVGAQDNTHPYNVLLRNNGNGTFTEAAADVGVEMFDVTWGGNFVDVDLDRDVDLYVSAMHQTATSSSDLFINQFPLDTFIAIEPPGMESDTMNSFANAIGDIDNDGRPDIAVNNGNYFGQVNKFQLWRNTSNLDGHWLKIRLRGIESNRDAVGSKIEFFIDGQKYIRYTQCGSAYISQNSFTEMIGTGTHHTIDSLRVIWPSSGKTTTLYQVVTDRTIDIYETDVIYVNRTAAGGNNGLSWPDAFTDLNDALAFASESHIKEIWVKADTYTPHANDRTRSFELVDGVAIYGGFNGTETLRSQRNPALNPVILSGEIGAAGAQDNAYHVVRVPSDVMDCLLDGVIITAGYADGSPGQNDRGGGIFCQGALTCMNVELTACYAVGYGAAIFADGWRAVVHLQDVTLDNHVAAPDGLITGTSLATIKISGTNEVKQ